MPPTATATITAGSGDLAPTAPGQTTADGAGNQSTAQAIGTITIATNASDADTVTIDGKVYTFRATPSSLGDVAIGASAVATATNLDAAIAGGGAYHPKPHPTVEKLTLVSNALVIAARDSGTEGNTITLAKTGTNITLSGATLASGSGIQAVRHIDKGAGDLAPTAPGAAIA